ncbi:hypothetical protein MCG44_00855 [Lawsonibacter sp. OA9]|uniref:hypothetical protein n=1 Tax=Lawsonibacter sp. OA9 TaxID=2914163 RepID=UPI001F05A3BE|nr:hypothetical protein [Lawsonibacter sp. OA9]MCH1978302.1 hypothetical protein [Lawsonibacter sp. OA9]
MDRDGNEIRLDVVWPNDAEKKQFRDLIETLKVPAVTDDSLKEEIITIGAQALTGEKEIEDCTGKLYRKFRFIYRSRYGFCCQVWQAWPSLY